ncbi:MAG: hypothetical protein ACRD8Z_12420 [Nitrososphaeraceae archaeon]
MINAIAIPIANNAQTYSVDFQQVSVASTNELGPPDSHIYSPADLRASVIEYDIHFTNISQDWNEYPDEGTRIRIQPIVTSLKNIKV